jgi:hypothetical protein
VIQKDTYYSTLYYSYNFCFELVIRVFIQLNVIRDKVIRDKVVRDKVIMDNVIMDDVIRDIVISHLISPRCFSKSRQIGSWIDQWKRKFGC